MGDDAMHHIINDGSTADDAYTQEKGENIVDKEDEGGEEGGEYEEDDEPVVAAAASPAPAVKGRGRPRPLREEAATVQSGDLRRMNASPRRGRR
jgi:hypothetical protein